MGEGNTENSTTATETSPANAASGYPSISLKIWPPTQRSRDAVIQNLVDKLTADPFLKRYGLLSGDEAGEVARRIEQEAFDAASGDAGAAGVDDDGMETLQIYSREISKRMLDSVKARASNGADASEKS